MKNFKPDVIKFKKPESEWTEEEHKEYTKWSLKLSMAHRFKQQIQENKPLTNRDKRIIERFRSGADFFGEDEIIDKIQKENWFDFDTMIATPDMMPLLGKLGRVLGPKGLMPNPKTGTVTMDTKTAVEDVKKGRVEYRTDSYGNVHVLIGKVSFDNEKLVENLKAFVSLILKTKPAVVKGKYILNVSVSTTMGPGIKIDANSFDM